MSRSLKCDCDLSTRDYILPDWIVWDDWVPITVEISDYLELRADGGFGMMNKECKLYF